MNVTNIKAGASNSTTEHSDWSNGYGWEGLIGDDTWAVTNSGTNTVIYYRYPKNVKICSFQGTDYYDTIKDVYEDFNDTELSCNKIVSGKKECQATYTV